MTRHILVSGDVTYHVLIHCQSCKNTAFSRHSMSFYSLSAESIEEALDQDFRSTIPNIPIGWRMDGRTKLTCAECNERTN